MCGIIGGGSSEVLNPRQVLGTIIHRGPDSQGFFVEGKLFLGHTRLSIQDLSENGNQPMFSKDRRFVIVFNGEIYNHLEIRKMLVDVDFKSTGDTETVLCEFLSMVPMLLISLVEFLHFQFLIIFQKNYLLRGITLVLNYYTFKMTV